MATNRVQLSSIGYLAQSLQLLPDEVLEVADAMNLTRIELDGVPHFSATQATAIRQRLAELRGVAPTPAITT